MNRVEEFLGKSDEPKPTLQEDAAEYMRIQDEWIDLVPVKEFREAIRQKVERAFYAGAVSTMLLFVSGQQTDDQIKLDIIRHMKRSGMIRDISDLKTDETD